MKMNKVGVESSFFYLFTSALPVIVELPGEKRFSETECKSVILKVKIGRNFTLLVYFFFSVELASDASIDVYLIYYCTLRL